MTRHKHFKSLVRSRMSKTGESYSTARRQLIGDPIVVAAQPTSSPHFAGSIPGPTAFRIALAAAGVPDPRSRRPLSEAMAFGIAGGIGIGTFSFVYEKADVATFYITGRHLFLDDCEYLRNGARRLGIEPVVVESTSAKKGAAALPQMLEEHGPCIAWVDSASVPHRAMPDRCQGGGYHIVTVYSIDDDQALIGDMTDAPVAISLDDLNAARGRIKKFKNRLMYLPRPAKKVDLKPALLEGLTACCDGMQGQYGGWKALSSFSLNGLQQWGDQLAGSSTKDSWERRFTPGGRLWEGLISIYDNIEHYGTGGGLCRPMFATCLHESADLLKGNQWRSLAEQYATLGEHWSHLAGLALPDDVPLCRQAKELYIQKAELINSGGSPDEVRVIWAELEQLAQQARHQFPLSPADCADLRATLQEQVLALHRDEVAACDALKECLASV